MSTPARLSTIFCWDISAVVGARSSVDRGKKCFCSFIHVNVASCLLVYLVIVKVFLIICMSVNFFKLIGYVTTSDEVVHFQLKVNIPFG